MIKMHVQGLSTEPTTHLQTIWLVGCHDKVMLPIALGGSEALSIYMCLKGLKHPQPFAHDLIQMVLEQCGAWVEEVRIVDLKGRSFYAELVIDTGGRRVCLEARPSDAVALALRCGMPVYLAEEVMEKAGYEIERTPAGEWLYIAPLIGAQASPVSRQEVQMAIDELLAETKTEEKADTPQEQLEMLKRQLRQAVQGERYEEAGDIKKEIERIGREQQENAG